jgi:hypothetical protein
MRLPWQFLWGPRCAIPAINSNAESFANTLSNNIELIQLFKETRSELIAKSNSLDANLSFNVGKRE